MVKPIRDKVLIRPAENRKQQGLIIIPDSIESEELLRYGEIIDFGGDVEKKGELKKGDLVWYTERGYEMNWDNVWYAIVRDCHVAIIKG